jgi:hypothetical protein
MRSGQRSGWPRWSMNSRTARVAVPLAIPVALGLALVIALMVSGGPVTTINQAALGSCASQAADIDPSASTGPSASTINQGRSASTINQGRSASAANEGRSASTVNQDPSASTVNQGRSGSAANQGPSASAANQDPSPVAANPAASGSPSASTPNADPAAVAANADPSGSPSAVAANPAASGSPSASAANPAPSAVAANQDPSGSPSAVAANPDPSGSAASPSASAAPCVSASASGSASATATAPLVNPEVGEPDLAEANPVDPANNPISLTQSATQAANTMNCTLIVPDQPLSAEGLATPWQLSDGCSEANPNEEAFVEASILGPNGKITVYNPLVITQGTTPAATPVAPRIRRGSQVIVEIGFNGNNLVLEGAGAYQGRCIDAFGNSIIAQTSACNAPAFFADADYLVATGRLRIPQLGMANDGETCESTHSFSLIDQDPSDNVDSEYLLSPNGQTAQDSAANKAAMGGSTVISNGSDEGLLDRFVDPALGCTPAQASDPTNANGVSGSQALNELSARQNQRGQIALLPVNDPQLLVDGQFSIGKTDTYRALTDQPLLPANANKTQMAAEFCQEMVNTAPAKLQLDQAMEANFTTPVPATGDNLATFMGARLSASFTNLGCQNFGLTNPVSVTVNGNGVATAVSYNTAQQQDNMPQGTTPGSGRLGDPYNRAPFGRHGHRENGSGM